MPQEPKMYPLTSAQSLMYLSQKYSFSKAIVDICIMLHFDFEVDEDILLQAIHVALLRNKTASTRLHKVGKEVMQYFSKRDRESIIVMDYSDKTQEQLDTDLNVWSQTPFPHGSLDCQLYKIRLIKKPDGFYGIFFCVNHVAFDAYALMSTASDMLIVYKALRDGLPLPKAKCNPLPCYEADYKYQTSEKHDKDVAFWRDVVYQPEPMYTSVNGIGKDRAKGKRYGKVVDLLHSKAAHINLPLSKEIVSGINDLAKTYKCSPQLFYLLAARSYLSKVNDFEEDVLIMNTIARRSSLVQKHAAGTRVNAFPFRMNLKHSLTLYEASKEMQSLQMQYYVHADLNTREMLDSKKQYNTPELMGYHAMSITFQPYSIQTSDDMPVHLTPYSTGANSMPIYLTIMALDNSGALNCNYDYMTQIVDKSVPYALHEHIVKALASMITNPELTLNDLNQL